MQYRLNKNRSSYIFPFIFIVTFSIAGICNSAWGQKSYKVAVFPEYLPIAIYEKFNPLISYLNSKLNAHFELVIPNDFNDYLQMVKKEKVDFTYQNPYVFIELWPYLQPLAITEKGKKWGIESRGVIIGKKSKGIIKADDLVGKSVSIVSFHSAEGFIAQKNFLKGMMINLSTHYSVRETNSNLHENVIVDVLQDNADAGFLSEEVFKKADAANYVSTKKLKDIAVIGTTSYIPNWIFGARKNLNPAFVNEVKEVLLNIAIDSEVAKAARIRRFVQIPSNYLEEYRSKVE